VRESSWEFQRVLKEFVGEFDGKSKECELSTGFQKNQLSFHQDFIKIQEKTQEKKLRLPQIFKPLTVFQFKSFHRPPTENFTLFTTKKSSKSLSLGFVRILQFVGQFQRKKSIKMALRFLKSSSDIVAPALRRVNIEFLVLFLSLPNN
jgi:hypothetical protein